MPSHTHIKKMVENNVVSSVMLTREAIRKKKYIYICADKGNKKGNKNLPKFICWYDLDDEKVKTSMIDCNCTDESIKDIPRALRHSIARIFPDDILVEMHG